MVYIGNYGYIANHNYSAVRNSSVCQQVYGNLELIYGFYDTWDSAYPKFTARTGSNKAFRILNAQRFHLMRTRTWSGIFTWNGKYVTISSSYIAGVTKPIQLYTSRGFQIPLPSQYSYFVIYNNTISNPFGHCVDMAIAGLWLHHNFMNTCGGSGVNTAW